MKTKSKPIRKRGVLTMDGLKKTFGKAAQAVSEKVGSNAGIWFYLQQDHPWAEFR